MEEFSEKLRETRREMKLSQKELSNIVGVSDKTIYRWENGTSCPSIKQKEVIAESLGFRKDYFYNEFEEKNIIRNDKRINKDSCNSQRRNLLGLILSIIFSILLVGLVIVYVCHRIHVGNLTSNGIRLEKGDFIDIFVSFFAFLLALSMLFIVIKTRKKIRRK